jgi:electron transfer flavoprotein alpha subunit
MSAAGLTLVIAELVQGRPSRLTCEILGLARQLGAESGDTVAAALLANPVEGAAEELIACGADHVYSMAHAALGSYRSESWVSAAAQLCRKAAPALVLAGHTVVGADLAPRLAFRLDTGIATGCVEVAWTNGKPTFTRPCFGGNARETLSFTVAPAVATVRAGCYEAFERDSTRCGDVTRIIPDLGKETLRVKIVERRTDAAGDIPLEDAHTVVAGGRGLNGPEGFRSLEELAHVLGGAVGASRVPCDLGWCPRSWQIGLTGRTVQPELYVAVGISGAGHHMAGCGSAKTIVAVNSDPDAPIFRDARFGVVGDYQQFVPAFIDEVRKLRKPVSAEQ